MQKKPFHTGNVTLIAVTHTLHDIFTSLLASFRPLLKAKFEVSLGVTGLWDLLMGFPRLLNPLIGIIAEKTAARYFIILTPATTAISMGLLGIAPNLTFIAVLLIMAGLSSTIFHVPSPVMMKKVSGDKPGKGMGAFMFAGEIARTLGPLIATGAISLWGFEGTWKMIPFGLLASLILFFRLKKLKIRPDIPSQEKPVGIWKHFKKLLPFFLLVMGFIFFRALLKAGLAAFLPTYFFDEKNESYLFSNLTLAAFQLAGATGSLVAGSLSDRMGRKRILLLLSIAAPLSMILFFFAEGYWIIPALIITGLFSFAHTPILLTIVQEVGAEKPTFSNSIFLTISFGVNSLAIILTGMISDMISLNTTFQLTAILSLGSVIFAWFIPGAALKK